MIITKCQICGKQFKVKPYKFKNGGGKFCSRDCYYESKKGIELSGTHKEKISNGLVKCYENENRISWNKGKKMTDEYCKKASECKKGLYMGIKSWLWKGGKFFTKNGYIAIYAPNHPNTRSDKHILEHRLVMEKYLGRFLREDEIVHHINKNVSDNRIENLELMKAGEHTRMHNILRNERLREKRALPAAEVLNLYNSQKKRLIQ